MKTEVKILIADDSRFNRMMLQHMLTDSGYDVDLAEEGREAVELFSKNMFNLILLDMEMPGLSGPDALQLMRDNHPEKVSRSAIIALTGHKDEYALKFLKESGFDDVLVKPIEKGAFLEQISYWLMKKTEMQVEDHVNSAEKLSHLYDLKLLNEFSDGDPVFEREMLTYFIHNSVHVLESLEHHLKVNDLSALK